MSRSFVRFLDPLYERLILVLTVLFCSGLALLLVHVSRFQAHLMESMARANQELYAHAVVQLPSLYTSEIVDQVLSQELRGTFTLIAFLAVLWLGGLGLVLSKLRHASKELERGVLDRTDDLKGANQELEQQMTQRMRVEEELRRAHDELEQRVSDRTAKLGQANQDLMAEISDRKRAEDEVRQLNKELMQQAVQLGASNKELEAFSYSVAHDLRAPLRGIDGFCQAVLDDYGEKLDATGQNYLHRARDASQRMAKLIDGILNLARLIRAELTYETVNLSELARLIVSDCQGAETNREVEWIIADGVSVSADGTLMHAVMENLLQNAWKFTSQVPVARIEFGVTRHYGHPVLYVRDNGVGFDMAYAHKLFGAFQRLHAVSEFPGIGIGLATVQRIIQLHGGKIWADATVGYGATFYFTLEDNGGPS